MADNWFAIVEILLVFGVVFGFGWHQLRELARYRDADAKGKDRNHGKSESEDGSSS